jgi:hypothetical protein
MTCILVSVQEAPPTILAIDAADIEEIDDDNIVGDPTKTAETVPAQNDAGTPRRSPRRSSAPARPAGKGKAPAPPAKNIPAQNAAGTRTSPRRAVVPAQNNLALPPPATTSENTPPPAPTAPAPRRSPRKSVRERVQTDFMGVKKENK